MNKTPPKYLLGFFRWFCNPEYVEDIEGDLLERFAKRPTAWRFFLEVLKLLRPSLIKPLSGYQKLNYYGMFKHNIKIGWRSIVRKKSFALINIAGLSTAAAVCLLSLIFYRYETGFDSHHRLGEQTFRVVQKTERPETTLYWGTTAYPLAGALRNDFPDFGQVTQTAGPMNRLFSYTRGNGKKILFEEPFVLFADQYYPQTFDFEWVVGDPKTALQEINAVVLTELVAEKCFGKGYDPADVVDEVIMLNNKDALLVKGIIKSNKPNINLKANMLVSYEFFKKNNPYPANNWSGNYRGTTFVVLNDPAQNNEVERKINDWKSKYLNEDDNQIISYALQPLSEIHTDTKYGSTPQGYQIPLKTLNISLGVAAFILLIAIINFINLVTANASIRSKEVGVRKVIGGSKRIIISQFVTENTLLVSIAFTLAIAIAYFALEYLNEFLSIIHLNLSIQIWDVLVALIFCLFVALLATIYPSFVLSSFNPIQALYKRNAGAGKGSLLRKGLTFFQFTIVQVFLIAAIIIGHQLDYFDSKSLGFDSERIISIPVPSFHQKDVFVNELLSMSEVNQVSVSSGPPMSVENFALGTRYREPHQEVNAGMGAEMKIIDSTYLALFDLSIIAGRNIRENKSRFDEFIITRKLAESLNWTPSEAIGKRLMINEGEATIVGVIDDFHNHSLQHEFTPVVLMNWEAFQWKAYIRVGASSAIIPIEQLWRKHFPEAIFNYSFVNDLMEKEYVIEKLIFTGFKFFSVLVIIIACLGLFGLVSFITLQRTKEVGIRKVLGASVSEILFLFTRQFTVLILIAFVFSAPIAWYMMDQWLNTFTYKVSIAAWMFVVGGLVTFILGSVVTVLKSYRTALLNPAETLKDE